MNKNKLVKIAASVASLGMIATTVTPVFAADATDNVARTSITMHDYVIADTNAELPAQNFQFSVTPVGVGDDTSATTKASMPALSIDANANEVSKGQVTTAIGEKIAGTQTANSVESEMSGVLDFKYSATGTGVLTSSNGVAWAHAGVYKYFITETSTDTSAWDFNSANDGYQVEAYVVNGTSGLETQYVVVKKATESAGVVTVGDKVDASDDSTGTGKGTKAFKFENEYTPVQDLTLSKTATGSAADKTEYTEYSVKLTLPTVMKGTTSEFDVTSTTASYTANSGNGQTAVTNPTTIKANTETSVYLKTGDSITFKNLPAGTTYTVTAKKSTNDILSYQVTEGGEQLSKVTGTKNADLTATSTMKTTSTNTPGENKAEFFSDSSFVAPTGLALSNLAAIVAIIGAAGFFAIYKHNKNKVTD